MSYDGFGVCWLYRGMPFGIKCVRGPVLVACKTDQLRRLAKSRILAYTRLSDASVHSTDNFNHLINFLRNCLLSLRSCTTPILARSKVWRISRLRYNRKWERGSDVITTVVMFTVVAINHNCHKLNLNCQITMYHLTSMIVDPLLTIFGAKLCQYQNCDALDAVLS